MEEECNFVLSIREKKNLPMKTLEIGGIWGSRICFQK